VCPSRYPPPLLVSDDCWFEVVEEGWYSALGAGLKSKATRRWALGEEEDVASPSPLWITPAEVLVSVPEARAPVELPSSLSRGGGELYVRSPTRGVGRVALGGKRREAGRVAPPPLENTPEERTLSLPEAVSPPEPPPPSRTS